MTPEQAANETRQAIVGTTSGFMFDPALYAKGLELGFQGLDIYVAGRGGVLGEVPADVVVAALVFFAPEPVHEAWERSAAVMPRAAATTVFAAFAHSWASEHFGGDVDFARTAELLGRIVAAASVTAAPLFAGWRLLEEPRNSKALTIPKALTIHRMNALRELRGALHGAAVLTVGLTPLEALSVRTPQMVGTFGWPEAIAQTNAMLEKWKLAEARTDRMLGKHFAVLAEAERVELVELLGSIKT